MRFLNEVDVETRICCEVVSCRDMGLRVILVTMPCLRRGFHDFLMINDFNREGIGTAETAASGFASIENNDPRQGVDTSCSRDTGKNSAYAVTTLKRGI